MADLTWFIILGAAKNPSGHSLQSGKRIPQRDFFASLGMTSEGKAAQTAAEVS
jgi:hypothetical protein